MTPPATPSEVKPDKPPPKPEVVSPNILSGVKPDKPTPKPEVVPLYFIRS